MSTEDPGREGRESARTNIQEALRALASASEEADVARQQLNDALESISEGVVLFDANDRIVTCNSRYRRYFEEAGGADVAAVVKPGASLWDIMRAAHKRGMFPLIGPNDLEAHIERRKALRRNPGGTIEQYVSDGRWLQINEHRTANGGIASVYTDVTVLKGREAELAEKTAALETLSAKLAKYLPPQVYRSIFTGEQTVELASRRKKLTIFFSDIAGFTDSVDALESEELTGLLNQYLTEMSAIAQAHGATVDKYIGDAILAFFGDPVSRGAKDDALACVHMAIAMQQRMRELSAIWRSNGVEQPFELRIGITTGYCTVGNFGSEDRLDYTAIGNAVNLASRLQVNAEPGAILLDSETRSLVEGAVRTEDRGSVTIKGFARPIKVFGVAGDYRNEQAQGRVTSVECEGMRLLVDYEKLSDANRKGAIVALEQTVERLKRK
jgi:class 3 adenylate cyclase